MLAVPRKGQLDLGRLHYVVAGRHNLHGRRAISRRIQVQVRSMRALEERVAGEVNPYVYFAAASARPHGTHTLTHTHTHICGSRHLSSARIVEKKIYSCMSTWPSMESTAS